MNRLSSISFLVLVAFVAFVEGPLNPFWVWNALPVGVCYVLLKQAAGDVPATRVVAIGAFAAITCTVVVLGHIAWMFDALGVATDSSTSSLFFIFLPIYAVLLGAIGAALLAGGAHLVWKRRQGK